MAIKTYDRGSTAKLSENFKVSELLCHGAGCCTQGRVDEKLVEILQNIRSHFGKPVHISSAYRCPAWNKAVGGVERSYHCYGQAADIKVEGVAPAQVAKYAESIGVKGIGLYETDADGHFVHVDTRTKKSFWYGQKQEKRVSFGGAQNTKGDYTMEMNDLKTGMTGEGVKALQILLNGRGYSCGTADGIFGAKTAAAVRKYQKAKGLTQDGIVGKKTMSALLGVGA